MDQVIRYQVASDDHPSVKYMRWHSNVGQRFLSLDLVLHDPPVEMPPNVPDHVTLVLAVPLLAHAPDRCRWERRLPIRTRASRRRDMYNDDDDDYDADPYHGLNDDKEEDDSHSHSSASNTCLSMVDIAREVCLALLRKWWGVQASRTMTYLACKRWGIPASSTGLGLAPSLCSIQPNKIALGCVWCVLRLRLSWMLLFRPYMMRQQHWTTTGHRWMVII